MYVGIDVSKEMLDVAMEPTGESWRVRNTMEDIGELATRLASREPILIVFEATGGFEATVAAVLAAAGLPVAVVAPGPGLRAVAGTVGQDRPARRPGARPLR